MTKNILFIGMDVHKESIEIAIAKEANTEVRRYGKIGGTQDAMRKNLENLLHWESHFTFVASNCWSNGCQSKNYIRK
ncbi:MAG: hypothetical protein OQK75_13010 [Gammaproteobacteria bacterium]|nr:hypothetical protein [Gammaproteobacteria bacterium]MCW8988578.1 hypothetical protein [Gammaproteobacteria bacterium]MCW9030378.1 hypothetical protein [Gammaproteobacteria bacterium]